MSFSDWYILRGHEVIQVETLEEWGLFMEERGSRTVARTELENNVLVSTVFLGIDHGWGDGIPVLFETMIFGGVHDQDMWRYCTWDEAVAGHASTVEMVKLTNEDRKTMPFDDFIKTSAKLIDAQKKRKE